MTAAVGVWRFAPCCSGQRRRRGDRNVELDVELLELMEDLRELRVRAGGVVDLRAGGLLLGVRRGRRALQPKATLWLLDGV